MNREFTAVIFSFILAVLIPNLCPLAVQAADEVEGEVLRWVNQAQAVRDRDDQIISYVHGAWRNESLDPESKLEAARAEQAAQDFLLRGMLPSCRELIIENPTDDFSYPTLDDEEPHAGSWG